MFSGRKGTWLYKLGQVRTNHEQVCLDWRVRNLAQADNRTQGFDALPKCPCSLRDVWRKTRFMWTFAREDVVARVRCYRLNRVSSQRVYPFGKVRYQRWFGRLLHAHKTPDLFNCKGDPLRHKVNTMSGQSCQRCSTVIWAVPAWAHVSVSNTELGEHVVPCLFSSGMPSSVPVITCSSLASR